MHSHNYDNMTEKDLNQIKVVLVEHKRTNKRLAEQLGRDQTTISKWCTNSALSSLETLIQIAQCLKVDVKELIRFPENENKND